MDAMLNCHSAVHHAMLKPPVELLCSCHKDEALTLALGVLCCLEARISEGGVVM
jgi:hypothetical protein